MKTTVKEGDVFVCSINHGDHCVRIVTKDGYIVHDGRRWEKYKFNEIYACSRDWLIKNSYYLGNSITNEWEKK